MRCIRDEPSTSEAFSKSLGIDSIAEVKMIMPKETPMKPFTTTTNTQGLVAT